ncbi:MAG: hypothetical protein LBJ21_06000, partial [Acidobacteriota bacterium]|nr:hypothetical protein [Acidobacteriota bacterium]
VVLIYKITHIENWSGFDACMLLAFRAIIVWFAASLILGHLNKRGFLILLGFVILMIVISLINDISE